MSDETTTGERVGFCQDCGKPLSKETARTVGTGMFCEPCLQIRLAANQSPAGAAPTATGYGYTAPAAAAAPPNFAGDVHPWIAGLLGFIPGVGAMYNGQFAKGIAHLVVFAVLVSLANHVSDVFGLFVAAWIFYMAFEAYHTARARRDGLPLPNAFGFNDIGEKMGFGKSWPMSPSSPAVPRTPSPAAMPGEHLAQGAGAVPPPPPAANWFGYAPPASASYQAGAGNAPYSAPVPPTPYSAPQVPLPMPNMPLPPMPAPGASFPLVAIWLIGLGVLFALAEWMPSWHVNSSSVVAILLGALAASIFVRRLGYMGGLSYQGPMLHMMRWPMFLAVWAVLFLLQGIHAATIGQTWPVVLLALGAVLLGERLGMGVEHYPTAHDVGPMSVVPSAAQTTQSQATTNDAATAPTAVEHHDERDGYSR